MAATTTDGAIGAMTIGLVLLIVAFVVLTAAGYQFQLALGASETARLQAEDRAQFLADIEASRDGVITMTGSSAGAVGDVTSELNTNVVARMKGGRPGEVLAVIHGPAGDTLGWVGTVPWWWAISRVVLVMVVAVCLAFGSYESLMCFMRLVGYKTGGL